MQARQGQLNVVLYVCIRRKQQGNESRSRNAQEDGPGLAEYAGELRGGILVIGICVGIS